MHAWMQMMERSVWKPSLEICLNCPRCGCSNTKFCYYNNYSLTQPRYFCNGCRRYWTKGGSLRNVPVGGGCRKSRRGITTKSLKLSTNGSKTAFGYGNMETTTNTSIISTTTTNDSHIDVALVYANFLSQHRDLSKGNVLNNNNIIGSEIHESLGTINVDHFDPSLEFDSHIMTSTRALGSSNIDELMPQINIAAADDHNQVLPTENHDHQVFLFYQDTRSLENSCAGDFGLLFTPTLLPSQNALSLSSSHHIQTMEEASRDDHVPMVAPEGAFNNQEESLLNNDNYWTPLIDLPITIDHDTVSGRT